MRPLAQPRSPRRLPPHAWVGALLVVLCWWLNWSLEGLRTHLFFFPLWLGFVLLVDGATVVLRGDSLATRSRRGFGALFLTSIPVWWLFELFNLRLRNWEYVGREEFSDLAFVFWCSLSFSTVMPAVFSCAELVRGFGCIERFARGPRLKATGGLLACLSSLGLASLGLMLAWPQVFFPFAWVSLVLIAAPLNHVLGRRSLLDDLERGDWRPWVSLWLGVLICGFFWELWNVYSYPKWIYHVPVVGEPKLFEMPVLGYLGYLPFALELFLLKELLLPRGERLAL